MLRGLVDWSLENRALVLIAAVLLALGGGYALTLLPIDAVPGRHQRPGAGADEGPRARSRGDGAVRHLPRRSAR